MTRRAGFSLVELSIVLVILGLITGGILAGQSLIRASQLRSVTVDVDRFRTAFLSFRDKYEYLPGDFPTATSYWGAAHATPATCIVTAGTGTQTCDGDGDNVIRPQTFLVANNYHEPFLAWQHLSNAGLIAGKYTGRQASANAHHSVVGSNVPASKISTGGYYVYYQGSMVANAGNYGGDYGHSIWFGAETANLHPGTPLMTPVEQWNIDKKFDDGLPAFGYIRANPPTYTYTPNCATSSTPSAATYNASYSSFGCVPLFTNLF